MPYFDGSGPEGNGPMTGRGFGPCAGGFMGLRGCFGRGMKRGKGFGRGYGRGMGRGWFGSMTNYEPTKEELEDYKKILEEEMEGVDEELKTL